MQLTNTTIATIMATLALIAAASCSEDSALSRLGTGCILNSDCEEGLACVFQRCHIQCNESGDCPVAADGAMLRCVVGDKPDHICQLEDERSCSYHSQCPGSQVCGPDGQCRDECLDDRDCVSEQLCLATGVCADPGELNENGELTDSTQPGGQVTGFPCAYDSQCIGKAPAAGPNFVCKDGGCNYGCYDTIDCAPNFSCEPDDGDVTTPGACTPIGGQTVNCIPGQQVGCPCYGGGADGVQTCLTDGSGFGACMSDQVTDCSPPQP